MIVVENVNPGGHLGRTLTMVKRLPPDEARGADAPALDPAVDRRVERVGADNDDDATASRSVRAFRLSGTRRSERSCRGRLR